MMKTKQMILVLLVALGVVLAAPALAAAPETYRTFLGFDSRISIWLIAEIHLMFGAFVLGVPIFAVTIEIIGWKTKDPRYDKLAKEFTQLLGGAFSFTALLGGLLTFTLFGLYPKFMEFLSGIFHDTMFLYAGLFFLESTTFYIYYYFWDRMADRKGLHILLGILLNVWGTVIMMVANSWAAYMMSPVGLDKETGQFVGTVWQAVNNPLWYPLSIHRFLGNVAFGGLICGGYAAIRYLGATTPEERAQYDWMGYVGNFSAMCGLIPLPFAGYYLGREVYSASAVMGNNMMGGAFSWTFIIQAILIGGLFIGSNYYLWIGMHRIPGAERYTRYIKFIEIVLLLCFAIWLTPHNLPLSAEEQIQVGGQYHPTLKYLGLMSGKNAVVNLIILLTFVSFLLYRRANLGDGIPFSQQGGKSRWVLLGMAGLMALLMGSYARSLLSLDPASLDLPPVTAKYFALPAALLIIQIVAVVVTALLTLWNRGKQAQWAYVGITAVNATFILGVYGYVIMASANPFLRNVAVSQWLILMSAIIWVTTIDVFLFKGAPQIGEMNWGKMPVRSQYTLIAVCVFIVMLIGLMGFIRSGLREEWHIYAILQDASEGSWTPDNALMAKVVSACVLIFLGAISFLFWLTGAGEKKTESKTQAVKSDTSAVPSPELPVTAK